MATTTNEIVWLHWLLADMGIPITIPTPLYYDNKSVVQIACNSVFHVQTKHIDIDCHTTQQELQCGMITLHFVSSSMQIIDFLTKSQIVQQFCFFVDKLLMLLVVAS